MPRTDVLEEVGAGADRASDVAPLPYARGGTRLKARHFIYEGIEQFRYFQDVERDTDCEWTTPASGDGLRCLPSRRVEIRFLDDQCTVPVITAAEASPRSVDGDRASRATLQEGDFVSVETSPKRFCPGELPPPREVYRVGALVAANIVRSLQNSLYTRDGAACVLNERVDLSHLRRLSPEPESAFLAGRSTAVHAGGGLMVRRAVGDDGSQQTVGVIGFGGRPCTPHGSGLCVPQRTLWVGSDKFALGKPVFDTGCTEITPSSIPTIQACGAPAYVASPIVSGFRIYPLTPSTSTAASSIRCKGKDFPPSGQTNVFEHGDEMASLVPRVQSLRLGSGRLRRDLMVVSNERPIPLERGWAFMDEVGGPCIVMPAADGSHRCLPNEYLSTYPSWGLYADEKCTEPVYGTYVNPLEQVIIANPDEPNRWAMRELKALWSARVHEGPLYKGKEFSPGDEPSKPCMLFATKAPTDRGLWNPPYLVRDKPLPFSALPAIQLVDL